MAETPELVTVSITGPDADGLTDIVRQLVDARLAACGNIIPAVRSIYRWEGAVEDEAEVLALVHTAADRLPELIEAVVEAHPYATPQVLAVPVAGANPGYAQWVRESTR